LTTGYGYRFQATCRPALALLLTLGTLLSPAPAAAKTIAIDKTGFTIVQETQRAGYDLRFDLAPPAKGKTFDRVDIVFAYRGPSDYSRFSWSRSGWNLTQVADGERSRLSDKKKAIPNTFRDGGRLIIRNRRHTVEITADSRRVLRAFAHGTNTGSAAIAGGKNHAVAASSKVQGVELLAFGEDFSRTEEETAEFGVWEPLSGDWQFHSVAKDIEERPDLRRRTIKPGIVERISNPFSLSGSGSATNDALVMTGYSFWNDYEAAVATKTSGGGMGLAFGVRDEANLWFTRWRITTRRIAPSRLELVKRVDGTDTVVGTATVPARTDNWYRLAVKTLGSTVDVSVDGRRVISARDEQSTGGPIGLMAFGEGTAHFDDVNADSVKCTQLAPGRNVAPFDATLAGRWTTADDSGAFTGKNAGDGTPALRMLGSRLWTPESFEGMLTLGKQTRSAGLVFAAPCATNQWRIVWHNERGGRLVLSNTRNGNETYRQSVPLGAKDHIHIRVERGEDRRLKCFVNGQLELIAYAVPELTGRVGLLADTVDGVTFSRLRLNADVPHDWELPVEVGEFAHDPFMQGWASPRHAWLPVEQTDTNTPPLYRHKGDFYGDMSVSGPLTDGLCVRFGDDDIAANPGYAVSFAFFDDESLAKVTLERCGLEVAHACFEHGWRQVIEGEQVVDEKIGPLPLPAETVTYGNWEIRREGRFIVVEACGRHLIAYRDPTPLTGRELGLSTRESLDLGRVVVKRDRIKDELFERATTGWSKVGAWEVTNRFSCDPRWSHMNGRSRGVAALWSKLEFSGDYTLEYYAGMRMRQGDMLDNPYLYYPRVGDINVALCADGADLFSGYNLVIAAWDKWWSERWTRFMRQGKTVKETDRELIPRTRDDKPEERAIEVDWDPGGRPIHGAWYFVKIRKTGARYDVWFDNVPVLSYEDRSPLAGKRLALWTQDNSIVLARVRIGYRSAPETVEQPLHEIADKEKPEPPPAEAPFLCPSHPGRHFDFETGLDGWSSAHDDQGARVELVDAEGKRGKRSLRLANRYGGGNFQSVVPLPHMDLERVQEIAFDCAIPRGVYVNMYVRLKKSRGELCYIALSGPDEETANLVRLGRFSGFKADGRWRRVSFRLAEALRQRLPERKRFVLEEISLGYRHGGYLNAGLGGNAAGASYEIDNLTIASSGPATGILCRAEGPAASSNRFNVLSAPDITGKDLQPLSPASTNEVALAEKGLRFLNIFSPDGKTPTRLMSIPVRTDKPLGVKYTTPRDGRTWDGGPIRIQFATDTAAHLLAHHLALSANGVALPVKPFTEVYDRRRKTLVLDPPFPKLEIAHDESVDFVLSYKSTVSDPHTNSPSATVRWAAKMDHKDDDVPPSPVELDLPGMINMTFDRATREADPQAATGRVRFEKRPRDGDRDNRALSVINNTCGGYLSVYLNNGHVNAGRLPLVEFDYCVIPEARVDLYAKTQGDSHAVGLNDVSNDEEKDGVISNACADGKWRHAEFDLAGMIAANRKKMARDAFEVRYLGFADGDYCASPPGAWYAIDNIRTVPVISTTGGEPFRLRAHDVSGISGYSYAWSRKQSTSVDRRPETKDPSAVLSKQPEGEMYFHVRACDGAGNWGPTTHHRVLVDNTPPAVESFTPPQGVASATSTVSAVFADGIAELDFSAARMIFNGRSSRLASVYTAWIPEQRRLSWQWVEASRRMNAPIPNGSTMTATLSGLRDFAGNDAPPVEWKWRLDYASDRQPPPAPRLHCWSQRVEQFDDFTDGTAKWDIYDEEDESTEMVSVVDPDTDDPCLQLTKIADDTYFAVYAFRGRLETNEYDVVAFDYKLPPDVKFDIRFYAGGDWFILPLTGSEDQPDALRRVKGIQADGKWHSVLIDLPGIVRKAIPDGDREDHIVRYLMFGCWQRNINPIGASVCLDNFAILKKGLPLPEVSCSSVDATGIRGHSFAIDRDPRAEPPRKVSGSNSRRQFPVLDQGGMWYIHARARDGAGNWGATRHYPYYCQAPLPLDGERSEEKAIRWDLDVERELRNRFELRQTRSAGGKYSSLVLSLRAWKADIIHLRAERGKTVPRELTVNLFNQGWAPLSVAPYVRVQNGDKAVGKYVELPPGKWLTNVRLPFDKLGDDKANARRDWGLAFSAPHRARSHVIIDHVRQGGARGK